LAGLVKMMAKMQDSELTNWLLNRVCSHWRAPLLYLSNLRRQGEFPAFPCVNCDQRGMKGVGRQCLADVVRTANNTLIPYAECQPTDNLNYYVAAGTNAPSFNYVKDQVVFKK